MLSPGLKSSDLGLSRFLESDGEEQSLMTPGLLSSQQQGSPWSVSGGQGRAESWRVCYTLPTPGRGVGDFMGF